MCSFLSTFMFQNVPPKKSVAHPDYFIIPDATSYAHHVFKAFDVKSCGSISFKVKENLSNAYRILSNKKKLLRIFLIFKKQSEIFLFLQIKQ